MQPMNRVDSYRQTDAQHEGQSIPIFLANRGKLVLTKQKIPWFLVPKQIQVG